MAQVYTPWHMPKGLDSLLHRYLLSHVHCHKFCFINFLYDIFCHKNSRECLRSYKIDRTGNHTNISRFTVDSFWPWFNLLPTHKKCQRLASNCDLKFSKL